MVQYFKNVLSAFLPNVTNGSHDCRIVVQLQKIIDHRLGYLDPCASILIFSSNNQHPIAAIDAIHEMDGDHQSVEWVMVAQVAAQEIT